MTDELVCLHNVVTGNLSQKRRFEATEGFPDPLFQARFAATFAEFELLKDDSSIFLLRIHDH